MANGRIALVLGGGGARAAYQVGALRAVGEFLGHSTRNPFQILCGTSAGAVNTATLTGYAYNFRAAVEAIDEVWRNIHVGQVYRADPIGIGRTGAAWLGAFLLGWAVKCRPRSLFDNQPLRRLLEQKLRFRNSERSLAKSTLYAVSITASGYATGDGVRFFQAHPEVQAWRRTQRIGCRTQLSVDHLMASSAIPFIFPAGRTSQPRVFRRRVNAPTGADFPGDPSRRRKNSGHRCRPNE